MMLNYNDEGFVKILLDEKSISFFRENLKTIENPLSRGKFFIYMHYKNIFYTSIDMEKLMGYGKRWKMFI
jgi:hypothetical protein